MDASVTALQSQNRLLRHLLLSSWGIVILLACTSFGRSSDDKLSVKELRLVDDEGRTRATLGMRSNPTEVNKEANPFLALVDDHGRELVALDVLSAGPADPGGATKLGSISVKTNEAQAHQAGEVWHNRFFSVDASGAVLSGQRNLLTMSSSNLKLGTYSDGSPKQSDAVTLGWFTPDVLLEMDLGTPGEPRPGFRVHGPSGRSAASLGCTEFVQIKTGEKLKTDAGSLLLLGPDGSTLMKVP